MKIPKLKQAIYVSKAITIFDRTRIEELVALAQKKNKDLKITGYLYYENGYFLQYIESYNGKVIDDLVNTLISDYRHSVINTFINETNRARRFSDWSMRYIQKSELIDLSLEGKIMDCMKLLAIKEQLGSHRSLEIWNAIDVIAKHKSLFQLK